MKNYKELKVWQTSIDVVKQTFKIAQLLPQQEKFGTISQMTRAAVSILQISLKAAAETAIKNMHISCKSL